MEYGRLLVCLSYYKCLLKLTTCISYDARDDKRDKPDETSVFTISGIYSRD